MLANFFLTQFLWLVDSVAFILYFWRNLIISFFVRNFIVFYNSACFLVYLFYTQVCIYFLDSTIHITFLDFLIQKVFFLFLIGLFSTVVIFSLLCFQLNFRENKSVIFAIISFFLSLLFLTEESFAVEEIVISADSKNDTDDLIPSKVASFKQSPKISVDDAINLTNSIISNDLEQFKLCIDKESFKNTFSSSAQNPYKFLQGREALHELNILQNRKPNEIIIPTDLVSPGECVQIFNAENNTLINSSAKFAEFFQLDTNKFQINPKKYFIAADNLVYTYNENRGIAVLLKDKRLQQTILEASTQNYNSQKLMYNDKILGYTISLLDNITIDQNSYKINSLHSNKSHSLEFNSKIETDLKKLPKHSIVINQSLLFDKESTDNAMFCRTWDKEGNPSFFVNSFNSTDSFLKDPIDFTRRFNENSAYITEFKSSPKKLDALRSDLINKNVNLRSSPQPKPLIIPPFITNYNFFFLKSIKSCKI